jgi:nitrate/TMAO reductase-like tetraheme cytochrome c subunit
LSHATEDNHNYAWVSAFSRAGDTNNCQDCHSEPNNPASALPFDEWRRDAHSNSAQNIHFLTMYLGTDVSGNASPIIRYGYSRDYGSFPLRPEADVSYYGPGYKLDFPSTSGNCAACHIPAAAINDPYGVNPIEVDGVGAEGIGCDFCHKVWDVRLNPATDLPYDNMPGVLSFEFRRPPEGHQFFSGPFDDVAPGEDTYTPIQRQSQFCAPCHFASFWDTKIYNSYGEWLESPYSNPQTGQTCQDCHMPPGLTNHFAQFDKGGKLRNPATIFSHRMPGAIDVKLLQNAVTMTVVAGLQGDNILVDVSITNDQTGHHVPTDSPLRQIILLVEASDSQGQALSLINGSVIPNWGGIGDPNEGYYAGLPGKGFAKILKELWTEIAPSGAYWNHTRIVGDNRIAAFATDSSAYTFAAPTEGNMTVKATLLFRRAFIDLMKQKSWDAPDIVMEQRSLLVKKPGAPK